MTAASTLADRQRMMRERRGRVASIPERELVSLDFKQRHYTVTQISEMWGLSADATQFRLSPQGSEAALEFTGGVLHLAGRMTEEMEL